MPPITLAFVDKKMSSSTDADDLQKFANENISDGYVLDGMQRLNTLREASEDEDFDSSRPIYINIIVAERYDFLLYRMITLNNGQKPMTARHQIEMLTKGILDTEKLDIQIITEKETEKAKPHGAFRQGDVSEAYTAFLTDSVHNQNTKIIESKLDEILVGKVMDSKITESDISFHDVLLAVDHLSANQEARDWLRLGNNLIGFAVGAKESLASLTKYDPEKFASATAVFEKAFESINVSKVNVGKLRRELAMKFVAHIDDYIDTDADSLTEVFFEETMTD